MKMKIQYILRFSAWGLIGLAGFVLLRPQTPEVNALLLLMLVECAALGLSALAAYVYTKVDLTREYTRHELGLIFLGVHICAGLSIMGVYLAQFTY